MKRAALDTLAVYSDRPIDAVLFDWGGTLAQYLGDTPRECVYFAANQVLPSRIADSFADVVSQLIEQSWSAGPNVRDTISSLTMRAVSITENPEITEDIGRLFIGSFLSVLATLIRHNNTAATVLAGIRRQGIKTAMVCNTIWPAAWHDDLLARDGLIALLPIRTYSSQTFVRKPEPRAFQIVLDRLQVKAHGCVFVGDRGDEDIDGAAAMGMATIWVRNGYSEPFLHRPDQVIDSVSELVAD
ncbi:HAD family hydrolase [Mycolicibacterium fluoranthenivorans]|uniref:HAD family hydrolase n=1 Tax=Mycolicibacterium fluoranthenivorans TaxID=258505 RepID=UPI00307DD630